MRRDRFSWYLFCHSYRGFSPVFRRRHLTNLLNSYFLLVVIIPIPFICFHPSHHHSDSFHLHNIITIIIVQPMWNLLIHSPTYSILFINQLVITQPHPHIHPSSSSFSPPTVIPSHLTTQFQPKPYHSTTPTNAISPIPSFLPSVRIAIRGS
jgi:hypothetical protein